ncbi:Na/Pi cotransporter family protein [Christensenellaceae bacterium OttesenSCG-928-M15]|nr:Na/Pi cotransporter family protein [Christensenellaceae bacterium OttesenSCG-928-M15]
MQLTDILGLLGGLALFLYGIRLMGEGLELLAGSRLKNILERLTSNRLFAMLVGLFLTALIQSSNALTAMTVNFVNVGLLDFSRAIGVIMGSNIGTTVTGQLIALKFTTIAPVFAFIGVILFLYFKKPKIHYAGQVLAGLGILFIGMNTMSDSMAPLKDVVWFQNAMVSFSNPLLGVAVGALFTALVQSSSASVGLLQAMAMQGLIGLDSAIYVLCGQNIGCTVAAVMAAIGGTKNAKRTALVHILFNVTGTLIFVVITQIWPVTITWIENLTPGNGVAQIANAHTIFNLVTTAVLLPGANLLARIATKLIPGEDEQTGPHLVHIKEIAQGGGFGAITIAIDQLNAEVTRMHALARDNLHMSLEALFDKKAVDLSVVYENEETIDYLNKEITRALVRINSLELTHKDAKRMSAMYHVLSDIERIGDHAENIAGYAKFCRESGGAFSAIGSNELKNLADMVYEIVDLSYGHFSDPTPGGLQRVDDLEEAIDDKVEELEQHHIDRLEANTCTAEMGMIYVEILTDLERVADHALNIAQAAEKKKQ